MTANLCACICAQLFSWTVVVKHLSLFCFPWAPVKTKLAMAVESTVQTIKIKVMYSEKKSVSFTTMDNGCCS